MPNKHYAVAFRKLTHSTGHKKLLNHVSMTADSLLLARHIQIIEGKLKFLEIDRTVSSVKAYLIDT